MWRKIEVKSTENGRVCLTCGEFKLWYHYYKDPTWYKWYKAHCIECFNKKKQDNKQEIAKQTNKYYLKNKETWNMRNKLTRLLNKDKNYIKSVERFKELDSWNKDFMIDYKINYLMNIHNIPPEDIKKAYKRFDIEKLAINKEAKSKRKSDYIKKKKKKKK